DGFAWGKACGAFSGDVLRWTPSIVIAGLVPAIQAVSQDRMDHRDEPGGDGEERWPAPQGAMSRMNALSQGESKGKPVRLRMDMSSFAPMGQAPAKDWCRQ